MDVFSKYLFTDLTTACSHLLDLAFQMSMQIAVAYVVLAAADVFYQWWDYERQIRMTKQEIKEEFKQTEGDPQIKGRIKELQRKMAQSRMMQKVPQADVVIRNPTHFAVALRYKADQDRAPRGAGQGTGSRGPAHRPGGGGEPCGRGGERPPGPGPVRSTDLNQEIPPELYSAVAEVLVYLYQMNKSGSLRESEKQGTL